jgi:hypothetical protein
MAFKYFLIQIIPPYTPWLIIAMMLIEMVIFEWLFNMMDKGRYYFEMMLIIFFALSELD